MTVRLPDIVQTDFSGGQINPGLKRRDNQDFVKTGAKQMQNMRIEAGGTLVNRPGRTPILWAIGSRTEYVRMQSGKEFLLNFFPDGVTIFNTDGTLAVRNTGYLWTDVTKISICVALYDIIVCCDLGDGKNMQPQILRWSPQTGNWTFLPYTFRVIDFQTQEPFYRFSIPGATMTYDNPTGAVNLTCSVPYFTGAMVGSNLSIVGQQVLIVGIQTPLVATANVYYRLPDYFAINVTDIDPFQPGMLVELRDQDLKGEVGFVGNDPLSASGLIVEGVMTSNLICDFTQFNYDVTDPDVLISPIGSSTIIGVPVNVASPQPTVEWTEEFMCAYRGWPAKCAYTAGRVAFYDFPQMPEAILWSAVGASDVCWVDAVAAGNQPEAGAQADSAILEFEASRPRIMNLVEWGDIFVFTDRGIFFIPISQTTPLSPGNVEFRRFSNDGVSDIRPISTQDAIVYINAGLNRCSVVRATGSLTRPYISDDVTESHAPLFKTPIALSIATGDGDYPERHVYVVNGQDGSLAVGKFTQQRTLVGWVPWTLQVQQPFAPPVTTWVTNGGPVVWFTTKYTNANGTFYIVEVEDPDSYLDARVNPAQVRPGMSNATYAGPFWHLAGWTVQLLDSQGQHYTNGIPPAVIDYGDRKIDLNGSLVYLPGTDATVANSTTSYAGIWSPCVYEPFLFPPKEGAAQPGARGKRRGLQRAIITVQHSNGFTFGNRTIPPIDWNEPPEQPESNIDQFPGD